MADLAMISHSAKETIEYARKFAKRLKGGEIIGLIGDLGGGKTTFTKGLAEGLGIKDPITSPTFVLLKEYTFRQAILRPLINLRGLSKRLRELVHIDAYRVENIEDIKSVGIEDYFERSEKQGSAKAGSYFSRDDVVMVIEWAEKIREILPKDTIYIEFKHIDENTREISIKKRTCVKK